MRVIPSKVPSQYDAESRHSLEKVLQLEFGTVSLPYRIECRDL